MSLDTFYCITHDDTGQLPHLFIDQTVHGKGVRARTNLTSGTILVHISGPRVNYWETIALGKKESYCLQVGLSNYIKPLFPFFLFNHSCVPNCGINEQLQLITLRDMPAGEELTWDYSTSMLERGWTLNCSCGQTNCRQVITDFDLLPKSLQKHYLDNGIVLPFIKEYMNAKK